MSYSIYKPLNFIWSFPGNSMLEFACNAGDTGSTPGSERSPGEGNGNLLQYSFLGNPMDRGLHGLPSIRFQRVRHDWVTKQKQQILFADFLLIIFASIILNKMACNFSFCLSQFFFFNLFSWPQIMIWKVFLLSSFIKVSTFVFVIFFGYAFCEFIFLNSWDECLAHGCLVFLLF